MWFNYGMKYLPYRPLTKTDLATAALLSEGMTQKGIARVARISINSVKSRVDTILFKTHSQNVTEAIHKITKAGLLVCILTVCISNGDIDKQRRHSRRRMRPVAVQIARKAI